MVKSNTEISLANNIDSVISFSLNNGSLIFLNDVFISEDVITEN